MSRLDSFIRRVTAQRACLNHAMEKIAGLDGPVLELGLGNGRTYDHLREGLPDRDIFVFERKVTAHPACIPSSDHLIVGDLHNSLPNAREEIGAAAVLIHADIGSGNPDIDSQLADFLSAQLPVLMSEQGLILCDQALSMQHWTRQSLPEDVPQDRYFLYAYSGAN